MNPVFTAVPETRSFTDQGLSTYSDYMLCELMAVQDELITRLSIARAAASGGTVDFLSNMIRQHEKDAARLLALFEHHSPDVA